MPPSALNRSLNALIDDGHHAVDHRKDEEKSRPFCAYSSRHMTSMNCPAEIPLDDVMFW